MATLYTINGTIYDRTSGQSAPGLHVEAWDKSVRGSFRLGDATTDGNGFFRIEFDSSACGDPNRPPNLSIRVFQDSNLIRDTEGTVQWTITPGDNAIYVDVELPGGTGGMLGLSAAEVGLHELGGSLADTVATVQEELARYSSTLGAFLLDEIALDIPVSFRVDSLGQLMTTVSSTEKAGALTGMVHLKVRPVLGASHPRPPVRSNVPLTSLSMFAPETIAYLNSRRIFTVDDLVRIASIVSSRQSLIQGDSTRKLTETTLNLALARAGLLRLPTVPLSATEILFSINVDSIDAFLASDPMELGNVLQQMGLPISPEEIYSWQTQTRELLGLPLA
jgi:hypothetical protein